MMMCCAWWMAPLCWVDQLTGCRFRWVCNLHDWTLAARP